MAFCYFPCCQLSATAPHTPTSNELSVINWGLESQIAMCTKLWIRYQEIALNQGRSKTPELQCVRFVGLLVSVCDLCDTIWMLVVVLGLFDILFYDLVNRVCQVNSGKMKYFEHKLRKSLNLVGALSNTNLTVKIILVEREGRFHPPHSQTKHVYYSQNSNSR